MGQVRRGVCQGFGVAENPTRARKRRHNYVGLCGQGTAARKGPRSQKKTRAKGLPENQKKTQHGKCNGRSVGDGERREEGLACCAGNPNHPIHACSLPTYPTQYRNRQRQARGTDQEEGGTSPHPLPICHFSSSGRPRNKEEVQSPQPPPALPSTTHTHHAHPRGRQARH